MRHRTWMLIALVLAGSGCAARRPPAAPQAAGPAATRPADPALLALDQIEPAPLLPAPATQPSGRPPLDAIELYAQARGMQLKGDRGGAVAALERALQTDPDSFELNHSLGHVQAALGNTESALKAFTRAATVQPDNLDTRVQLAKLQLSRNDPVEAMRQLRLAMLSSDYRFPEYAAVVDFLLARCLQQKGYDSAALQTYGRLIERLQQRLHVRFNPELFFLMSRPEAVYIQAGELAEKCGRYDQALKYYQLAAAREPESFDYQSHVVHARLGLKQIEQAKSQAMDLVVNNRASSHSMQLLKEVYKQTGGQQAVIDALRKLLDRKPRERVILFALADTLAESGDTAEAERLLRAALAEKPGDSPLISRLFDLYLDRGDTEPAARLLIEYFSRSPENLASIEPLWGRLIRLSTKNHLTLSAAQRLQVAPAATAAKLYLVSRLAEALGRETLARGALEQAAQASPPFAPAYRELLSASLQREDWDQKEKTSSAEKLIRQAKDRGRSELASELRGILCVYLKDIPGAVAAFEEAVRAGSKSPALEYALAAALHAQGKETQSEQLLWRIVSDWPTFDDGYATLFRQYLDKGSGQQALKVLQTWLSADPFSVSARLLQADVALQSGRMDAAEPLAVRLFEDEPENPAAVGMLNRYYAKAGKPEEFLKRLEEQWKKHPENRVVAGTLVQLYVTHAQINDALRVADGTRAAVANDVDQLYFAAHLYDLVHRQDSTEAVLEQALKLDPSYGPANNDLGYMWADEGKNLDRAESLIRLAVSSDPENAAYLDSLGWVLYKRSKFAEARRCLEAATKTGRPDPVVLDHLGDALYRLNERAEAARVWHRSMDRLMETTSQREDLKKLRQELEQKLRRHDGGESVNVAPISGR